jgi:hypothetical protein
MKVAVVGGGIVGRLAAWATMQAGHTPVIFDRMQKPVVPRGFVYLHSTCGLPLTAECIEVIEVGGNREDYALKVYGGDVKAEDVSWGKFRGLQEGYNPAEAMAILSRLQHGMVQDRNFENWGEIEALLDEYERVVFTLPVNKFLKGTFPVRRGSVGAFKAEADEDVSNLCVYSADPNVPWYRAGFMFGYVFYEYPEVITGHVPLVKVMPGGVVDPKHRQLHEDRILRTGRFGAWRKDMLSDDAYEEVLAWLSKA